MTKKQQHNKESSPPDPRTHKRKRSKPSSQGAGETRCRIEANVKESQVLATISLLQTQIGEWFEVAPKDMHEGFDKRLRRQIGSLID